MLYLLASLCCLAASVAAVEHVTVTTTRGRVQGFVPDDNLNVTHFYGIPYAKPPTGDLRWERPQPADAWNDTFIAESSDLGLFCMQRRTGTRKNYNISENCLTLNVYTKHVTGSKAVLIHIHGGGFARGSAREYEMKHLTAQEDLVIVTINYRLGIFGNFDSDGDGVWENLGLWDTKLALQWVQDNIAAFGGDKSMVTITGGSSAGMTVTILGASPAFKGLFHRIIGDSGTLLCPKLIHREPKEVYASVLRETGCTDRACLKKVNSTTLETVGSELNYYKDYTFPTLYTFAPYIDGETIIADPFEVWGFYRDGSQVNDTAKQQMIESFRSYDYMAGFNTQEGSLIVSTLKKLVPAGFTLDDGANKQMIDQFLDDYLKSYFPKSHKQLKEEFLKVFYDGKELTTSPQPDLAQIILNMYTDLLFATPTLHLLDSHSKQTKTSTYLFTFTHETAYSINKNPVWFRGAEHTDERAFVFGEYPVFYGGNINMTGEEQVLSRQMMSDWGNFIRTGNPNSDDSGYKWRQYTRSRPFFKQFGAGQLDVNGRLYNMRRIQSIKDREQVATTPSPPIGMADTKSSNVLLVLLSLALIYAP